ncbi:hypothetical protein [Filomicrobium sp.]|uniref:hypothetical protein n=1 Tax=Filomicrobium sp. TaxID=2024831 RepID=UPI0025906712|nr:hypothetical protein [Filomicrobium sp.]MCV0369695.1 hypothetical protein [Filomicrobium sp.]
MLLTRILRYPVLLLSALLLSAHVVEAQTFDVAPDVTQAPLPAIEQPEGFTGLPPAAMPDLPAIEWRVANPFRFFSNPRDTEVHRATWLALSPAERRTPVLSAERALSSRHEDGWAATMVDDVCWDTKRNRYRCPGKKEAYATPTSHTIIASLKNIPEAGLVDCTWLTAPHGGDRLRGDAITAPCHRPVELSIPYPAGATIEVEIGSRRIATTDASVTDLFIVGMGDSFAAGDGNPDIPVEFSRERSADYGSDGEFSLAGFPARVGNWNEIGDKAFIKGNARWLDQACHRSLYSHQARAALQLAIEEPHRAVTYVGLACSGAETIFGLFLRYKGNEWVENPPELSQISAAAEVMCGKHDAEPHDLPEAYHMRGRLKELEGGLVLRKCDAQFSRKIDLLFLSVGGNDIGFARLLANAILANESLLRKLSGWIGGVYGTAEATIALRALDDRYKSLNRALHNILHIPWDEPDRIILTAYPGLALMGDGSAVCPDGRAGMEIVSDFALSSARAREGIWIADKLHHVMEDSARRYGWSFAQRHRAAFIGRGICAGFTQSAFSIADDLRLPRKVENKWVPYNPADYRSYASRQRWFRTPNDAFLTGNFHVTPSLLQKVLKFDTFSWFQLLLASTYSGAFHPTAEGQAAMADSLLEIARPVLDRYHRRNHRADLSAPL